MPSAWGIRSLYLWWIPKIKNNHFSTCCNTIVFFNFLWVKYPLPHSGVGSVMGNRNLVTFGWQRAIYLLLIYLLLWYWPSFRTAGSSPSEGNDQFWWLWKTLKWESGSHFSGYLSRGKRSRATGIQPPSNKSIFCSSQFYGHVLIKHLSQAMHSTCNAKWPSTFWVLSQCFTSF